MTNDVTEWSTITANVVTIIAGLGMFSTCLSAIVVTYRKGREFLTAVVTISQQFPVVVKDFATLKEDVAELKKGQQDIATSQVTQQKKLKQLEADVGDLRRRSIGAGNTHVDLRHRHDPDAVLDELDEE